jgi:DNA-binding transcriptional LysR family regulator
MADLNEIAVFVKVAQAGSFTKASRLLGIPVSTVSRKVSLLEERLGVSLIQRTTRKLHITDVGAAYLHECAKLITGFDDAETAAISVKTETQGLLKITCPVELGIGAFNDLLNEFMDRFPKVSIELVLTDRFVDFIEEGVDLGVRFGELEDSSLMAHKLGVTSLKLIASNAYLKSHGTPQSPKDLESHNCLNFTSSGQGNVWELLNEKGVRQSVQVQGSFAANNLMAIRELALKGRGIALLPLVNCGDEVRAGKVKVILPEWSSDPSPMHVVYPAHRFVAPKVQAFVEFLTHAMRSTVKGSAILWMKL